MTRNFGFSISDLGFGRTAGRAARGESAVRHPQSKRFAPGFSFTEVLFAVMILGVGFIMVAAIFPVAIQQARTSTEETTGAAVSRGGANYFEKIATNNIMPATATVVVGPEYNADGDPVTLSTAMRGNLVPPGDGRVAWVPLYRRSGIPGESSRASWSAYAQVFMIPVYVRNQSEYISNAGNTVSPYVHQTRTGLPDITATVRDGINGAPDTIEFTRNPQYASEGAYVVVANVLQGSDLTTPWNRIAAPDIHGRIYRLGNRYTGTGARAETWELMPGFDFAPLKYDLDENTATSFGGATDGKEEVVDDLTDALVFVVGRGVPPGTSVLTANASTPTEGVAQDVAAYTSFVYVK